ncbi:hypothetical protein QVD17_11909 [Tagetes erecta]|uniref:Uncharacterized protein n=1 Tax=Tagetes erecta TaxID=13708 RepID=A0AAD8P2G4_TARER|nr:hypothetical protein QVD17_11909 [Tagetes erecta]
MHIIWPQLQAKHQELQNFQNGRSKLLLMALATKDKETMLYELDDFGIRIACELYRVECEMIKDGTYFLNKEDPIIRLLGAEHGGRSRTVSDIIGYTKVYGGLLRNHDRDSIRQGDTMPFLRGGACSGSNGGAAYSPIELNSMVQGEKELAPIPPLALEPQLVNDFQLQPAPKVQPTPKPKMALVESDYDEVKDRDLKNALQKVNEVLEDGLLKDIFIQLSEVVGSRHYICHSSPYGMYPKQVELSVPYSQLLGAFSREWLDATVILTFAM